VLISAFSTDGFGPHATKMAGTSDIITNKKNSGDKDLLAFI
jgi:hypothetical protein